MSATTSVASAPTDTIPDVVRKRGNRILGLGLSLGLVTALLNWSLPHVGEAAAFLAILVTVPTSIAGFFLILRGWGVRNGALWALKSLPEEARGREDVKRYFYGDEHCAGCGVVHPDLAAYCGECGHALNAPDTKYWSDVKFAFKRLVRKMPVEPPRTAAFRSRAPHETTDKLLLVAIGTILAGWLFGNKLTHLAEIFVTIGVLVPAVLLLFWLRKQDRYEPEPWLLVLIAFGWGMLCIVFVVPLNSLWIGLTGMYQIAGVTEEIAKAAIVVFIATHRVFRKEINGPGDGLIYAGAAGLGFAAAENLFYVVNYWTSVGEPALAGIIARASGTIAHMSYAGITGSYLGLMQLRYGRVRPRDLLVGFVPAAIPHALNNTDVFTLFTLLGVPTLIASWWFFKALSDALRDEEAWGYHEGQAPVEPDTVKETPPPAA